MCFIKKLRQQLLKIKKCLVLVVNAYRFKEYVLLFQNFKLKLTPVISTPMLVSVIDNKRSTQGLTDRLKGIVSLYAFAKANGIPFGIIFNHPFELTDFLTPNKYNWKPDSKMLDQSLLSSRFIIMRKQSSFSRMFSLLPIKKQYRVYANIDYLSQINACYDTSYQWNELFEELFAPSPLLSEQINFHLNKIGGGFIACVFRFQSLLDDFKETGSRCLHINQRLKLIEICKNKLTQIAENSTLKVLVTSDSSTFLNEVQPLENVYVIPGKVVHMDFDTTQSLSVYLKSFVDFFVLSNARKIYSIGTEIMYQTDFPKYAAKLNNVAFERVEI